MPAVASQPLVAGFTALEITVSVLFVVASAWASRGTEGSFGRTAMTTLLGAAVWISLTGAVAASGLLARFDMRPPPVLGLFVGVLGVSCAIGLSPAGERLARGLPVAVLVGVQAFRLPLELLMHQAAHEGVMPAQMSFSGYNFDILTGTTAIPVAVLAALGRAPRALVVAWNALGIALLAVILGLAFASTPMVHAFGEDPRMLNTFVARVPFVWLPAVLVVAALSGHVVLTRRLLIDRRADAAVE